MPMVLPLIFLTGCCRPVKPVVIAKQPAPCIKVAPPEAPHVPRMDCPKNSGAEICLPKDSAFTLTEYLADLQRWSVVSYEQCKEPAND